MGLSDVKPGPFRETGKAGEPTESDWLVIGDRRYKVFAVPRKTPTFVAEWCYGGIIMTLVGLVVLLVATRGDTQWAARIYWQKKRWYTGPYRWHVQEEFATEEAAKARAAEFVDALKSGVVPPQDTAL